MASIESFVSKFYGPTHEYVHQLDPFSTFTITMKFFPCLSVKEEDKSFLAKLLDAAVNAGSNLINNATGGLASAIGGMFNDSVQEQHDNYRNFDGYSFIDYLGVATMLDSGEQSVGSKLVGGMSGSPTGMPKLNLTEFVQDITVPQLTMPTDAESQSLLGKFQGNGSYIAPDTNEFMLTLLNTKMPIVEYIFYPWMREVTLPYWSYDSQPYTTATTTISFDEHQDIQYVFTGCRPKQIQTIQPNNVVDGSALRRQVSMLFDFMFITSKKMNVQPSATDLLLDTGKELLGGAAGMLGL